MVRVAVIDSGVNPRHPHIGGVAGGVAIVGTDYLDVLGHGTAVMAAIQQHAPVDAGYYAVRVFDTALRTNVRALLKALQWAIAERMDVVNLSLGTANAQHAALFAPFVEDAAEAGVALVSALNHYPGCMPGVFGVGLDEGCPVGEYRVRGGAYYASGYPRAAEGIPRERNLQGISFAVANMSGFIARARAEVGNRSLRALREALQRNSAPTP
jgi:subtilisin family serine protease